MVASNGGRHSFGRVGVLLSFCVLIAWVKLYPEDYDPKNIDYVLCVGAKFTEISALVHSSTATPLCNN
jgi:hypothetical protein